MLNWYVVKTKNNKEEFAKQNLINQNFQVYLPIVKTIKKFGNKLITVKKALFPNYIFVKIILDVFTSYHKTFNLSITFCLHSSVSLDHSFISSLVLPHPTQNSSPLFLRFTSLHIFLQGDFTLTS